MPEARIGAGPTDRCPPTQARPDVPSCEIEYRVNIEMRSDSTS